MFDRPPAHYLLHHPARALSLPLPHTHPNPQDDHTLASRGMDGTMRIWDLRNFTRPVKVCDQLPANYSTTNCCFSPDEKLLITGTAAADPRGGGGGGGDDSGGGTLVFVDVKEMKVVRRLGMPAHAAAVRWHDRINQIFVGVGEFGKGALHVEGSIMLSE